MARVITIDFETYYESKGYSLKDITTAEYVNDARFQTIGVSVAVNGNDPEWCSGNMQRISSFLSDFNMHRKGTIVVAHNAMFDGAILEWKCGIKPWMYFCTMMASRPTVTPYTGRMSLASVAEHLELGQKGTEVVAAANMRLEEFSEEALEAYAGYCKNDVALTWKVFKRLAPLIPKEEMRLIDLTIKKFTRPQIVLDKKVINDALIQERNDKAQALADAGLTDAAPLMSNPKFADLLTNIGVDPPQKISPATGKVTWAFAKGDPAFKAMLAHPNPQVRKLVKARFAWKSTINETRLDRFKSVAECTKESYLAVPLLYYGAHPGRFSGFDKLNLQNMGRKSPLRRALIAPPGHKIVAGDLSQIEARITACLAGQTDLVELFRHYDNIEGSDRDVYCEFGDKVYSRRITKAHEKERFVAKTGVLSLGFQSGGQKFYDSMLSFGIEDMTLDEANSVVYTYRAAYPNIVALWGKMEQIIRCMISGQGKKLGPVEVLLGQILLPNNMFLTYPELSNVGGRHKYKFGKEWRDVYGGKLTENVVQALARIVMTTAELRLAKAGLSAALSVHDELVFVVPDEKVEITKKALHMALTAKVPWMPTLPVNCEIGVGDNYADAK